ncbi:MAG: PHP domain-containing protein [Bacteroidales bacterium]|jgi:histidinol phosphatase-like PHP family hydrolase|nr:PHP domain-containing protein [Bacteroidales bacterium]
MKTRILLISIILAGAVSVQAQRRILSVPELPGYVTLKCDFHMHTVFSDGNVWPTQRVGEAWRDGLDAIAITDHLEYQPKKQYIPTDHSAAWKIARSTAADYNIILVKGSEITRKMPPGHLNALFISEPDSLVKDDFMKAVEAAVAQGAFIEWNHPGWKSQQPDGIPRMYPVHEELIAKGWLHGIEYYNDVEFYPLVMDMCRDNKLALMGNSDVHGVISEEFAAPAYSHRPMTLVFARERTHDSLKEAMFARRTAVWYGDNLAAFEDIAAPLFKSVITAGVPFRDDGKNIWFELSNSSDIPMTLSGGPSGAPATLKIPARGMVVVRADRKFLSEPIPYSVDNIITGSNSVLKAEISPAKK